MPVTIKSQHEIELMREAGKFLLKLIMSLQKPLDQE